MELCPLLDAYEDAGTMDEEFSQQALIDSLSLTNSPSADGEMELCPFLDAYEDAGTMDAESSPQAPVDPLEFTTMALNCDYASESEDDLQQFQERNYTPGTLDTVDSPSLTNSPSADGPTNYYDERLSSLLADISNSNKGTAKELAKKGCFTIICNHPNPKKVGKVCGKEYRCDGRKPQNTVSKFKEHLNDHVKPSTCPSCPYTSSRTDNLSRHAASCHGSRRSSPSEQNKPFLFLLKYYQSIREAKPTLKDFAAKVEDRMGKALDTLYVASMLIFIRTEGKVRMAWTRGPESITWQLDDGSLDSTPSDTLAL